METTNCLYFKVRHIHSNVYIFFYFVFFLIGGNESFKVNIVNCVLHVIE